MVFHGYLHLRKKKLEQKLQVFHLVATKHYLGASPVAQWLRIHLPTQGTRVQALVREDPTCHGATKPLHHNY